jgi:hypothetical protein
MMHRRSTFTEITANQTVPNRFRTLARVKKIIPRNAKGSAAGDLAVLWCKRCNNTFDKHHCRSCNDKHLKHADVRWQLAIVLEAEGTDEETSPRELIAVFDGDEAATVFNALPPLATGPNEVDRLRKRIADHAKFNKEVENLLFGARFNGERTRPLIDWTLESYAGGPNGRQDHLLFRVFGMRKGTRGFEEAG